MTARLRLFCGGILAHARPDPLDRWAIVAGLMATTAMPPFVATGWLIVPALALLFGLLANAPRPARVAGWFGLAHQASLLHWIYLLGPEATISSRGLVPVMATLAVLYTALFALGFGWAFALARRYCGREAALILLPLLWTGMEAARGVGELGFPWCLSGAAWIGTPLLPLAATAGELGLGAATALTALALLAARDLARGWAAAGRERTWRRAAIGLAAAAWAGLALGAGVTARTPSADGAAARPPLRVAAIQADVALADKWDAAKIDSTIVPYSRLTARAAREGAQLAVWAETAVPDYLIHIPALLTWVRHTARDNHIAIFLGYPHATLAPGGGEPLRYNGAGLFRADGRLEDFYAKFHLLPFGERMPFSSIVPAISRIDFGQAEWMPGALPTPMIVRTPGGEYRLAGLICYESIFPELSRVAVRRGAELLVNITNDGWFGVTAGPRQHAELARLRAAECGVPLVRCANNGISFVTDARGRIVARAGLRQRAIVAADVTPGLGGTLFVRWGSRPAWAVLILWSALATLLTRTPARNRSVP
jgi:apolipoprotein N-acyltransferase